MGTRHRFGDIRGVSNRIQALREARGWSRPALAQRANTSPQQIERLEKGARRLSDVWLNRLAPLFDMEPWQLLAPADIAERARVIPIVGRIACGDWEQAVEDANESVVAPPGCGPRVFALRARGDSMNLIIDDGGYAIIDPDQTDLVDGKIFAVLNGEGEATLKRYRATPPRLVPMSNNPNHKEVVIGQDEFRVIGRAVWRVGVM